MSEVLVITLEHERPSSPSAPGDGWWVDDNRINIRQGKHLSTYTLPRGCRRVTLYRGVNNRSQLSAGGLKSITFSISGPDDVIAKLREAIL